VEKKKKKIWILLLSTMLVLPGCGTILSNIPMPVEGYQIAKPFGGVTLDYELISEYPKYAILGIIDLPLSLAADTSLYFALIPFRIGWNIIYGGDHNRHFRH